MVTERNYLDVYVYERWRSSAALPIFEIGDSFQPSALEMAEGSTTPPLPLSEADLIKLMDRHGIGTDAIAEHIKKVQEREFAAKVHSSGHDRFVPTNLGHSLIAAYREIGEEECMEHPEARAKMERDMKSICDGIKSKMEVVNDTCRLYKDVYEGTARNLDVFRSTMEPHFGNEGDGGDGHGGPPGGPGGAGGTIRHQTRHGGVDIGSYRTAPGGAQIAKCGKCSSQLSLKRKRLSESSGRVAFALLCQSCDDVWKLPSGKQCSLLEPQTTSDMQLSGHGND